MRAKLGIAVIGLIFTASACNNSPKLIISGQVVKVEIVTSAEQQQKGLSGRDVLSEDAGMLFVYNNPRRVDFWMKDMKFPLDIIWIREGKVAGLTENIQPQSGVPDSELTVYPSPGEVDMVLEVNAGWAKTHQINAGGPVDLLGVARGQP